MKKFLSILLAALMVLSLAACTKTDPTKETKKEDPTTQETQAHTEEEKGITFPLAEKVTFTIMVPNDNDMNEALNKMTWWKELEEATNVHIEFTCLPFDDTWTTLSALATAGKAGDAFLGGTVITDAHLMELAASNLIIELTEYVDNEELMPNYNARVYDQDPDTRLLNATPDGKVWSLMKYRSQAGSYIESPIWINKTWLDNLGLEIPTTIDELEQVLIAFRDNDCNGNGDATDEIPWMIYKSNAMNHFEAMLGSYGIATKDGALENYTYIENGEVKFAPTSENWKAAIKMYNKFWSENLIWSEAFTATNETYTAKLNSATPVIGMYNSKTAPASGSDQYVQIAPVSVDGYKTRYYIHPGFKGIRNTFTVFNTCENVDILMAWVDQFYTFELSNNMQYGDEGWLFEYDEDGKWTAISRTAEEQATVPYLLRDRPFSWTEEDFATRINKSELELTYDKNMEIYEDYLTDEIWPRPYILAEDSARISELRTDIMSTVQEKRAAWITGTADIDAEWDDFVKSIENMGLEEFLGIFQKTYDNYLKASEQ